MRAAFSPPRLVLAETMPEVSAILRMCSFPDNIISRNESFKYLFLKIKELETEAFY